MFIKTPTSLFNIQRTSSIYVNDCRLILMYGPTHQNYDSFRFTSSVNALKALEKIYEHMYLYKSDVITLGKEDGFVSKIL